MDPDSLGRAIRAGDRRALARVITALESKRPQDRRLGRATLQCLRPRPPTLRLGVTGPPGAGKSTLIDVLGTMMLEEGLRPAVLAYDPSSRTGGSVLGDRTRMRGLSADANAFVRPSPTRDSGGVGAEAWSVIALCERAGHHPVVVETVGVGQGEIEVSDLVDILVLVVLPHAGDEITGIKRGILEYADLVAVNKADGEMRAAATRAAEACRGTMGLFGRGSLASEVVVTSALEGGGAKELWTAVKARFAHLRDSPDLVRLRNERTGRAFHRLAEVAVSGHVLSSETGTLALSSIQSRLLNGELGIDDGVEQLLSLVFEDGG